MTAAGHQWGALVSMLAGEPLPVPPATGAVVLHHVDGFGPDVEKQMALLFGDEDRASFRPIEPKTLQLHTRPRWTPEKEAPGVFRSLLRTQFLEASHAREFRYALTRGKSAPMLQQAPATADRGTAPATTTAPQAVPTHCGRHPDAAPQCAALVRR